MREINRQRLCILREVYEHGSIRGAAGLQASDLQADLAAKAEKSTESIAKHFEESLKAQRRLAGSTQAQRLSSQQGSD